LFEVVFHVLTIACFSQKRKGGDRPKRFG
jgi:hypothetical protein